MDIIKNTKGVDSYGCGLVLREGRNKNVDRSLWDKVRGLPGVRRKLAAGVYKVEQEAKIEDKTENDSKTDDAQPGHQEKQKRGRRAAKEETGDEE